MTLQVYCDKCEQRIIINSRKWAHTEHNEGAYSYALFTLLGKKRNYTLCKRCEKLFISWLEKEPDK